ncbi:MAG: TonB family protein [Candidatus Firestonebacteria bacterium]
MQKNGDLKYTIFISIIIHFIGLLLFSCLYVAQFIGKTVYLTEITFIGEMPYGQGLGQKGEMVSNEGGKTGVISPKKGEKNIKENKVVVLPVRIIPKTEDDILKIRKTTPIGVDEPSLKTSGRLVEGPILGGGFGEDNEKPGSPDGNYNVTGPIASRGILYHDAPEYPEWARRKGIEGEICVQITVDPKGDVKDIFVIRTCGFKELDQLVIDCMRRWKFDSLPMSAKQIDQEGKITFKFNLKK